MIDLGTLAGLLKHDHQLTAYCQTCDRRVEFDLAGLVGAGLVVRNHLAGSERREVATHPLPDSPRVMPGTA